MISLLLFCSAMDILANCRAMLPSEPVTMTGEIVLRNRKGIPAGEYDYTLRADRTATPAKSLAVWVLDQFVTPEPSEDSATGAPNWIAR